MKYYNIVYTYYHRGIEEEQEMVIGQVSLIDALNYVRHICYVPFMEDFEIRKVYAETDDGSEWAEIQDWAEQERRMTEER